MLNLAFASVQLVLACGVLASKNNTLLALLSMQVPSSSFVYPSLSFKYTNAPLCLNS